MKCDYCHKEDDYIHQITTEHGTTIICNPCYDRIIEYGRGVIHKALALALRDIIQQEIDKILKEKKHE